MYTIKVDIFDETLISRAINHENLFRQNFCSNLLTYLLNLLTLLAKLNTHVFLNLNINTLEISTFTVNR